MKKSRHLPHAPSLFQSIRSIGYSLETAIADLLDNSITAGAANISVRFNPYGQPFIAILDDGSGMNEKELEEAMRHGSKDPNGPRGSNDLGRFGLGLKTASLSQCRRLIVVSLKEEIISARSWDLDVIIDEEDWVLLEYEEEDLMGLPVVNELKEQGSGTLVIWQDLDRIINGESSLETALGEKMDLTRNHLSMVFHRYLSGEQFAKKINISMNGNLLKPCDPFLLSHPATELLPDELVHIEGHLVRIKPYILPHISKLSLEEIKLAGGEDGLRKNQGFYIYRNKRLISWGTWFRLTKQGELSKLARVRIDIPNSMDYLWALDIKKSMATPPEAVRTNLKRIIDKIAETSKRVYTFRGRRINSKEYVRLWDRYKGREGIWYQINRKHPVVEALSNRVGSDEKAELELLLRSIEDSFPVDSLYADMASDKRLQSAQEEVYEHLKPLVELLIKSVELLEGGKQRILDQLHLIDPFCNHIDVTIKIREELRNG